MYEKLSYMLNANTSNNPSVAQQLMGLSFDEIVAKFIETQNIYDQQQSILDQQQVILDAQNAILANSSDELK